MLRRWSWFPVMGALAVLGTACGPMADGLSLGSNTRSDNAVTDLTVKEDTTINEGGTVSVFDIEKLCVDDPGLPVIITWDFDFAANPGVDVVTDIRLPDAVNPGTAGCDPGLYPVIWQTPADPIKTPTKTYPDDRAVPPAPSYTVKAKVEQGTVALDQDLFIAVANVVPQTFLSPSTPNPAEGALVTFTGSAVDPGTLDDEISYVYFNPGDGIAPTIAHNCSVPADRALDGICRNDAGRLTLFTYAYLDGPATHTAWLRVCDDSVVGDPSPGAGQLFGSPPAGCDDASTVISVVNAVPGNFFIGSEIDGPGGRVASTTVAEGATIYFTGNYRDPGADTQTIRWQFGDATPDFTGTADTIPPPFVRDASKSPADVLTPSHEYCQQGPYRVDLIVRDKDDGQGSTYIPTITVTDISPVFVTATASHAAVDEGSTVRFDVGAVTLSACDPINWNSFVWSCTDNNTTHPAEIVEGCTSADPYCVCRFLDGHVPTDNYTVRVAVSDEDSSSATSWTVAVANVAPTITNLAWVNAPITEGVLETFTRTFVDPSSQDTYTVTWEWGDGQDSINNVDSGTGDRTSTRDHLYAEDTDQAPPAIPPYTITLTVRDDDGGVDTETLSVPVEDVDPTGSLAVNPNASVLEGLTTVTATVTAAAANASDPLSGYQINWGDDTPVTTLPPNVFTATHDYEQDGTYVAILTVSDEDSTDDNTEANNRVTIVVDNVAPQIRENLVFARGTVSSGGASQFPAVTTVTVREGETVTLGGQFFDPSQLDTYTFQWTVTDGMNTFPLPDPAHDLGATRSNGTDNLVLPTYNYTWQNNGTWNVTLTVWDDDEPDTYSFDVVVQDNNPTFTVTYPAINEGETVNIAIAAASGCPNDANADDIGDFDPADETYQVDCAGGTGDAGPGRFVPTQTSATPSLPCTFDQDSSDQPGGDYQVTVRVYDEDSYTEQVYQVVVNNVAPTITLAGAPQPINEADSFTFSGSSFADPGADAWTAWWTFTDPKDNSAVTLPSPVPVSLTSVGVVDDVGPYLFADEEAGAAANRVVCARLNVRDDDVTVTSGCYNVTIFNTDPTFFGAEITTSSPVGEGTAINFFVYATDLGGAGDPLTYHYDWDNDGDYDTVIANQNFASHLFPTAGFYDVNIMVTDDDSGELTRTVRVQVINIPPEIIDVVTTAPKPENTEISVVPLLKSYNVGILKYCFDWNNDATDDCLVSYPQSTLAANWGDSSVGLHTYPQDGTYSVRVKVIDDADPPGISTRVVPVVMTNVAPVVSVPAPAAINEGQTATIAVNATDASPSDLPLRYQIDWLGNGTYTAPANLTGSSPYSLTSPAYADNGTYVVRVRVWDDDVYTEAVTTVNVNNSAPVISSVTPAAPTTAVEGGSVTLTVNATDGGLGNDTLAYAFDWNGDGTFDVVQAGNASTHVYANNGTFTVRLRVTDDDGAFAETTRVVTVTNAAPVINTLALSPASPVNEGTTATLTVSATDAGTQDVLTYKFDWNNDGTYEVVQGTNVASHHFGKSGSFVVGVRVEDQDGGSDVDSITVVVNNVAPVIASAVLTPANGQIDEGGMVTVQVTATDAGNDALTYEFDWDGDTVYDTLQGTGIATHVYGDAGSETIGVRVTDAEGASTVYAGTPLVVTIANVPPSIASVSLSSGTVNEGATVTVTVNASGGDGTLLYEYDFDGDGSYELALSGGVASHVYSTSGTYNGRVRVTDGDAETDTETFSVTVNNVAPVITGVTATSPVTAGSAVTVTVTATDIASDTLTYEFDWTNDGSYDLSQSSGIAFHTFDSSGTYTIGVRVSDGDATDTDTATVTVTDLTVTLVVTAVPATLNEGQSSTVRVAPTGTGPYLISWDWNGDGLYSAADGDDVDVALAAGAVPLYLERAHVFGVPGQPRVNVRVIDEGAGGAVAASSVTLRVNNLNPSITSATPPAAATEGALYSYTVTATDPGTAETLTYALQARPAGMTINPVTGAIAWTPTYHQAGSNAVIATVTDPQGGSASLSWTVVVSIVDSDGDGMSDTWETEIFGNLTTAGTDTDSDGDGVSDYDEFIAGTDPEVSDYNPPTAPVALRPVEVHVAELMPSLVVTNATDPDGDALEYTFEVYDNETYEGTPVFTATVVSGTGVTMAKVDVELIDGNTYWWRAQASDGRFQSPWTTDTWFVVSVSNNAPSTVVLLLPADGATVNTNRPMLEVRPASDPDGDALTYDFQVYSAESLASATLVHEVAGYADHYWTVGIDLAEDTTYWWRARAVDEHGASGEWSAAFAFDVDVVPPANVAPGTPVLLTPVDGSVVTTLTPMLEVRAVRDPDGDAVTYDLQVWADETMASGTLVTEVVGSAVEYWTVGEALTEDTGYWWRARASDGRGGVSAWSELFAFTVDTLPPPNVAPPAPATVLPVNDSTVTTLRPYLEVTAVQDPDGDAVSYSFRVYSDQAMATQVAAITGRGLPTWFVDVDLVDGQQYWWVATASDGVATSANSNTGHFTVALPVVEVNTAPTAPAVSVPAIGAVVTDTTPTLTVTNSTDAEGDELSYFFEVASNAAFVGSSLQVSAAVAQGTDTTSWTPTTALAEDTMYYWRARASDGELFSDWAVGTFTVSAQNGVPSVPVPLSPAMASLLQAAPTHLVAQNAIDPEGAALTYTFEIAGDVQGTNILSTSSAIPEGDGSTSWEIEGVTFAAGTTYYWRVQASDGSGVSGFSDWTSFTLYKAPVIPSPEPEPEPEGGCGCASSQPVSGASVAVLTALVLVLRRRRR